MSGDLLVRRLAEHIDGLARALAAAGAPADAGSRLLELSAVAAMHAVTLAELGSGEPEPRRFEPVVGTASALRAAA